jgi:hypothetical protein
VGRKKEWKLGLCSSPLRPASLAGNMKRALTWGVDVGKLEDDVLMSGRRASLNNNPACNVLWGMLSSCAG